MSDSDEIYPDPDKVRYITPERDLSILTEEERDILAKAEALFSKAEPDDELLLIEVHDFIQEHVGFKTPVRPQLKAYIINSPVFITLIDRVGYILAEPEKADKLMKRAKERKETV